MNEARIESLHGEVKEKLLREEQIYILEVQRSRQISSECALYLPNLINSQSITMIQFNKIKSQMD